jgi:CheY-like chemotaxis protein
MPKTVLLADDSVVIQKLVGLSFANEDLKLITTDNGDDALARAREEKPDMVLADVVMPGTNGYELCRAIKQDPQLTHIPVLLLTGTFEAFDEDLASQVGSAGHITKPFEAQGLVDRVQELLASTPPPAAATPSDPPKRAMPEAEATMIVQLEDDAYDFFDEAETDLEPEPALESDASDLGLSDTENGFLFGSDPAPVTAPELEPQPAVEVHDDLGAFQSFDGGVSNQGSDLTVAIIPEASDTGAPPPISDDPMATRLTFDDDFAVAAPAVPAQAPGPEAMAPTPPPLTTAPSPASTLDSFGSQNTAPLSSPPPLPASEPPTTEVIEGISAGAPPPLPVATDPGETMLADDLFADLSAAPEAADPFPPPETGGPTVSEDLAFIFDSAPSAATASPPPVPQPEISADSEPVTDPLAAPIDADPFDASPPDDLLSAPLADEDFAAGAAENDDLLETFASEDASALDVSSSNLVDPVVASFPPAPQEPAVASITEAESPVSPQLDATPSWPEAIDTPLESVSEAAPALAFEELADEPEAPPALALQEATSEPDISPMMRDRIHETLEKVAWEAFADLSDIIVRQVIKKVEEIAWEVVPQMAESLIQEEIRRLKDERE